MVKLSRFAKIRENRESFPPRMFCRIRYLADKLASVYSYRVMVKSVSSCCVRGSRVLSNPVTYEVFT